MVWFNLLERGGVGFVVLVVVYEEEMPLLVSMPLLMLMLIVAHSILSRYLHKIDARLILLENRD